MSLLNVYLVFSLSFFPLDFVVIYSGYQYASIILVHCPIVDFLVEMPVTGVFEWDFLMV